MKLTSSLLALTTAWAGAAQAEGVLNIYNWGNYTSPELITKFEETYDVKVTITDYDSNDIALNKVRQGGHGFDIAVPSQNFVPIWIAEGLLMETNPGQMENGKNILPDWQDPVFDPGRKYSAPWQWGTVGVVVNTDLYKGDINTWAIIFDTPEELKGKVNLVPEMNDVMNAVIHYVGGEMCSGDLDILKKARDVLIAAKPNWIAMEYGTIDKMLAGDFVASSDWNGSALRQRLQNPAIHYGYPKEGFAYWSDNLVVLADAVNVENAKLFQNFIMAPENAAMLSAYARYGNLIAGSEEFMPADMIEAPELTVPDEFLDVAEFQVACPPETNELYVKIWTELLK